jgi:hypothetical protein
VSTGKQDEPRRTHPDAILRRVGAGAVLVHLRTGEVFELNGTAARAWELASEGRSSADITAQLQSEFAGDPDRLKADVETVLRDFATQRLLVS